MIQRPDELGEGVSADPGLLGKDSRRGSRRSQADHLTTILDPGESEGTHSGGLPGAGGGNHQLQTCPGGAHLSDQCRLSSIECGAVRRHLQQGQIHRGLLDRRTVVTSRRRDETGLGVEDPRGRVKGGAGDGVDRRPVEPPQHLRFLDAVSWRGQGNRPAIEHLIKSRSTKALARSAVTPAVRICRCASARTCHICQVERLFSTTAKMSLAVWATQRASTILVLSAGGASAVRTIDATAPRPPSTAAASLSHVVCCSVRDRGSCLASRVSKVACCAKCSASTGVGGRP
jgi:hypothetical protein